MCFDLSEIHAKRSCCFSSMFTLSVSLSWSKSERSPSLCGNPRNRVLRSSTRSLMGTGTRCVSGCPCFMTSSHRKLENARSFAFLAAATSYSSSENIESSSAISGADFTIARNFSCEPRSRSAQSVTSPFGNDEGQTTLMDLATPLIAHATVRAWTRPASSLSLHITTPLPRSSSVYSSRQLAEPLLHVVAGIPHPMRVSASFSPSTTTAQSLLATTGRL